MKTDPTSPHSKAYRKAAAAAAKKKSIYEDSKFGRRRVVKFSKFSKTLAARLGGIAKPFLFIYRRLRPSRVS